MSQSHHTPDSGGSPESLIPPQECSQMLMHAPVGVFKSTPEGKLLFANPALARMFGYSSGTEMLESVSDIARELYADPEDRQELLRLLQEQGQVVNYECPMLRKDGSQFWFSRNMQAVRDREGDIQYYYGFSTDITERKQAEERLLESEHKFRNIFNSSSDAIFIHELSGRFLEVNNIACERLGYSRQELLGLSPMDIDGLEASCKAAERIQLLEHSGRLSFEGTHVRKDGEEVPVELTSRLIEYEGKTCILSTARDVSERKAAEAKRDEYQRILSSALRAMDSMFMVIDSDYRIVLCNWRDHEWVPEEHREQRPYCYRVLKDFEAPCDHCPPAKSFRDGRGRCYEDQNPIDNSLKEIDVLPILDEEGRVQYVLENVRDVTERKRAEEAIKESESRFRRLLAHVDSVAVQGYNMEGVTIYWNKASEILYGYTEQEALGQNLIDLIIPDEMRHQVQKEIQQIAASAEPIPSSELTMKRKDGSLVPVFSSHTLIHKHDGSFELFCVDIDLTEIKKAQDEQVRAKERAEVANRAKSEFLANMSHEIRTPLNGIIGMHQLLETTDLDQEQAECVQMAKKSAERLTRLLGDILDLSRVEAGRMELSEEHFQLADILQSVEGIFWQSCTEKGISLDIHKYPDMPGVLIGDHTRLTQILFNLVGNAVKYTSQGQVQVQASLIPGPDPASCRVLFIVQDSGQGIAEDKLDMVFETFRQAGDADSTYARQFEGAGLGLPLVKRLLNLMGGNACIVGQKGAGTTVYVSLPFGIPESMQAKDPLKGKEKIRTLSGLRVLLVEDEQTTQFYIQRLLQKYGAHVSLASDGQQALAMLAQESFDCVLMDVQMPVMDGVEATRRIRAAEDRRQRTEDRSQGEEGGGSRTAEIGGRMSGPGRQGTEDSGQGEEDRSQRSEDRGQGEEERGQGSEISGQMAQDKDSSPTSQFSNAPISQSQKARIPIIALTAYAMSGDREKFLEAGMDDYLAKPVEKEELLAVLERNLCGYP